MLEENYSLFYLSFWLCSFMFPREGNGNPTPVLLPGKSHGRRSLVGCSPWDRWESDTTERLHFHSSLSCIGEGNGNPLQCSCLENFRDGGAWWAVVYGVTQSWAWLKWLSSSSRFMFLSSKSSNWWKHDSCMEDACNYIKCHSHRFPATSSVQLYNCFEWKDFQNRKVSSCDLQNNI